MNPRWLHNIFSRDYGRNLYFITDGTYVKIGRANDVYKRLSQLQAGNPNPLWILEEFEDRGESESWVHSCLRGHRKNGEWYILNDAVKALIKSMIKEDK